MIITKFRIEEEHPMTNGTASWPLPYCDLYLDSSAGSNGYLVKSADGLGPTDFVSVVDGFDTAGVPVMDSVGTKREIAFRVGLKPGPSQSVSQLRSDLYRYISRSVTISMMADSTTVAQIRGYVQRIEVSHFSNQPEVVVSIKCTTSEFYSPSTVSIPTSVLSAVSPTITYNEGDAPTGLDITFTCITAIGNFSISGHGKFWHSGDGDVTNQLVVVYPFAINDVVSISTTPGARRISRTRAGVEKDITGYINAGAVWPKLYPGVNYFTWSYSAATISFTSGSYRPRYWGV